MDKLLDSIWATIEVFLSISVSWVDGCLSPLERLGPTVVIFLMALVAVMISALLRRVYTTRRYLELKEKFDYWYQLRQEAVSHADKEKGKAIAKNIDQAELNRIYYDYFFEGLLKNLVTTWLPIFIVLAYVNTIYQPENLLHRFGKKFLFTVGSEPSSQKIGSVFWFVLSIIGSFLLVAGAKMLYRKFRLQKVAKVL
jgi:hypothetical protein